MAGVARRRESGRRVIRVRGRVVVVQVTIHAVRRQSRIHPARVARRTVEGCVDSYQRIGVIKGRTGPRRRLVARLAGGRESGRGVIGIGRCIVIVEVAVDTLRRKTRVDAPRVTGAALLSGVRADQRPHRMRVGSLEPVRIGLLVAGVARRREPGRRVIRVCSRVVVVQVAVHTVGRQSRINAARVAGRAVESGVDSYQRIGVIKVAPVHVVGWWHVSQVGREPCRSVIRDRLLRCNRRGGSQHTPTEDPRTRSPCDRSCTAGRGASRPAATPYAGRWPGTSSDRIAWWQVLHVVGNPAAA